MQRRQLLLAAPLAAAAAGGGIFYVMLGRMQRGTYDPHGVPSPLVGKPVPDFVLPPLGQGPGLASAELRAPGRPVLVNFFASWCVPCVQEAPELMALHDRACRSTASPTRTRRRTRSASSGATAIPISRVAADRPGRVAIDFGLYGVPETYFIDKSGIIRWRWAGALSPDVAARSARLAAADLRMRRFLLVAVLSLIVVTPAFAIDDPSEMLPNPALEKRAEHIGGQLRCLVCQNESIEQSSAGLARDLRAHRPPEGRRRLDRPAGDRLDGGALRQLRRTAPARSSRRPCCSGARRFWRWRWAARWSRSGGAAARNRRRRRCRRPSAPGWSA